MDENLPRINSITFVDGAVEVVYAEPRDVEAYQASGILRTRVVTCPVREVEEEMGDLMDSCIQLLDKIALLERNPSPVRR